MAGRMTTPERTEKLLAPSVSAPLTCAFTGSQ
jgi:hypothetical protein